MLNYSVAELRNTTTFLPLFLTPYYLFLRKRLHFFKEICNFAQTNNLCYHTTNFLHLSFNV